NRYSGLSKPAMRDCVAFKKAAIRYWERRRAIYNLALLLPALFGYTFSDTMNWVGDPHRTHYCVCRGSVVFYVAGCDGRGKHREYGVELLGQTHRLIDRSWAL